MRISQIRHPEYLDDYFDFLKWRLTYKGGRFFIRKYLQRLSRREDNDSFKQRLNTAYSPSFAKAAINKLKNTFYSRMSEIKRIGGSQSYIDACRGKGGGVDMYGSSMNVFIGDKVIPELLAMKKVGIWVDMPNLDGNLLANNYEKRPYLYYYKIEDILTWDFTYSEGEYLFVNILLRETQYQYDSENGRLVSGYHEQYRHCWMGDDNKVHIQIYEGAQDPDAVSDTKIGEEIILDLPRIPFVIAALQESLLADAADYQIALLNLSSVDLNFLMEANFPFYVEQYDPVAESAYVRRPGPQTAGIPSPGVQTPPGFPSNAPPYPPYTFADNANNYGTGDSGLLSQPSEEIQVGTLRGRKSAKGLELPTFIAPPSGPLEASIKKQEQMKAEINQLINLAAADAQGQHTPDQNNDGEGIESGLAMVGLELQYLESEIAKIWDLYEGKGEVAEVFYPAKYSLKSDAQRLEECEALNLIKAAAPSRTFSKEIGKQIAHNMLGDRVSHDTMEKILKEIDEAEYTTSDPTTIQIASQLGMVDAKTGSNALGFDGEKVVPLARKEHSDRLAEIAASQATGAQRGVPDKGPIQQGKEQADNEKDLSQKNRT